MLTLIKDTSISDLSQEFWYLSSPELKYHILHRKMTTLSVRCRKQEKARDTSPDKETHI
jgi:hypothetical protein